MSVCTSPEHGERGARSGVSFTTMKPIGLSSRTTSPASVIQEVDVMPASREDLERGDGRPAARTTSRA